VIVFVSEVVEVSVPVATPKASVVASGWVSVLPVPVAESWTVCPDIGAPVVSSTVTVIVDASIPFDDRPSDGSPEPWRGPGRPWGRRG
jgi:hypothetical protein